MPGLSMEERATTIWLEIWKRAGEHWPPGSIPLAWRVYEYLKQALMSNGAAEPQAIAFADDFFTAAAGWGDLAQLDNHRHAIESLARVLIDSELVGLEHARPAGL